MSKTETTITVMGHRIRAYVVRGTVLLELSERATRACGHCHHPGHDAGEQARELRNAIAAEGRRLAREHGCHSVETNAKTRQTGWRVAEESISDSGRLGA